jgi:hypothetical protein
MKCLTCKNWELDQESGVVTNGSKKNIFFGDCNSSEMSKRIFCFCNKRLAIQTREDFYCNCFEEEK